ncbi:MAG: hypothetical protein H7319_09405 [Spirosoma sp.]|nr:hypothetical protein [Spirosoma sp.]
MTRFLPGPELFWLLLYAAASFLEKANTPPSNAVDDFIESLWFWIPVASLLIFGLWWIPSVEKNWLLLRVWIFGLLGGHLVLEKALSAYSTQGPGIGMGYLAGLILLLVFLVVGSIFIKIKF